MASFGETLSNFHHGSIYATDKERKSWRGNSKGYFGRVNQGRGIHLLDGNKSKSGIFTPAIDEMLDEESSEIKKAGVSPKYPRVFSESMPYSYSKSWSDDCGDSDSVSQDGLHHDLTNTASYEVGLTCATYRMESETRLRKIYNSACNSLMVSYFHTNNLVIELDTMVLEFAQFLPLFLLIVKTSQYNDALAGFEEILSLLVSEFGENHMRVATALHNVGIAHFRLENLEDAADALTAAIKIRKRKNDKTSPKIADSLIELGSILMAQQNHEQSLKIFEEAKHISEVTLAGNHNHNEIGPVHLQLSKIFNNIGCARFENAEVEASKVALEKAIEIQQICSEQGTFSSMPGFAAIANTKCNLGLVHLELANWKSAIMCFEEGLKIQQNIFEPTNVITVGTLTTLAYACIKFGAVDKALKVRSVSLFDP